MNTVAITGRLTSHSELKTTRNGVSVCAFDVAVPRLGVKDITDFYTCVAWRQTAETVSKYFTKGQKIEIVGTLTTRSWKDKDGNKRSKVEILCEQVGFGESKKEQKTSQNEDFENIADISDGDLPF